MTYVMSSKMYKEYTTGKRCLTHNQLIKHINRTFGLRGVVNRIQVGGRK